MTKLGEIVALYLKACEVEGKTDRTVQSYAETLRQFETARGELGCYVVSDGGSKPWRVKFRAPSFVALEATATTVRGSLVADLIAILGSLDTVMGDCDR